MAKGEFYIAFTGTAGQFAALSRAFDRLVSVKSAIENNSQDCDALVSNPVWVDLLDDEALASLTRGESWALEDIVDCVLNGEYTLVGVTFDGQSGRLVYDPWSYPFGGTDPLKALVEMYGLRVTRDSFHDGFADRETS